MESARAVVLQSIYFISIASSLVSQWSLDDIHYAHKCHIHFWINMAVLLQDDNRYVAYN